VISGIPAAFGDSVYAKVEYVPWDDKDNPVSGPITVFITRYTTLNDTVVIPVDVTSPLYGYRVYISPDPIVTATDKINTSPESDEIIVYPNPASKYIFIELPEVPEKISNLRVYNTRGMLIKELKISIQYTMIDVSDLETGLYIMFLDNNNYTHPIKFYKE
jgi:hypothetical protein